MVVPPCIGFSLWFVLPSKNFQRDRSVESPLAVISIHSFPVYLISDIKTCAEATCAKNIIATSANVRILVFATEDCRQNILRDLSWSFRELWFWRFWCGGRLLYRLKYF